MTTTPSNARRVRFIERILFWVLRLATYFILAAATYIFLDIGIKGSRTVFTSKPPFINIPFLTEPPQTLYVFDYEGKKMTLSDRQFRDWKTAHNGTEVEATSIAYSAGVSSRPNASSLQSMSWTISATARSDWFR